MAKNQELQDLSRNAKLSKTKLLAKKSHWICRELFVIILWLYFTINVFYCDIAAWFFKKHAPSMSWSLNHRLLSLLVMICFFWYLLGVKRLFYDFLYLISYPWILLFRLSIYIMTKHCSYLIVFAPSIYDTALTLRSCFVRHTLAIWAVCCIFISIKSSYLVMAMLVLGGLLIHHLARNLRRAYQPSVFDKVHDLVKQIRFRLEDKTFLMKILQKNEPDEVDEKRTTKSKNNTFMLYFIHWFIEYICCEIKKIIQSKKIDLYLISSWTWTICVTIFTYSVIYYGLYKYDASTFTNVVKLNYWYFLGFSVEQLLPTQGISAISPSGTYSTIICYSEMICAVIIIIILFFIGLTAVREKYNDMADKIISELKICATYIDRNFDEILRIARSDAELILMQTQGSLINKLRKLRELEALPIPEENP